jgi:hypothetical protein
MPIDVISLTLTATVPGETYRERCVAMARAEEALSSFKAMLEGIGFADINSTLDMERQPVPRARKVAAEQNGARQESGGDQSHGTEAPLTPRVGDAQACGDGMSHAGPGESPGADERPLCFVPPEPAIVGYVGLPEGRTEVPHGRGKRTA